MRIQRRDVVTAIIFSIITCGIYGIYWYICLVNDARVATKDETLPTGGTAFLLTLITCGIYGMYLFYKLGKSMYESKVSNSDNSLVFLLLAIFQFGIVNYCIIQSDLNKYADSELR